MAKRDKTAIIINRSLDARWALNDINNAIKALKADNKDLAIEILCSAVDKLQNVAQYISLLNYATTYSEDNWNELFSEALEKHE